MDKVLTIDSYSFTLQDIPKEYQNMFVLKVDVSYGDADRFDTIESTYDANDLVAVNVVTKAYLVATALAAGLYECDEMEDNNILRYKDWGLILKKAYGDHIKKLGFFADIIPDQNLPSEHKDSLDKVGRETSWAREGRLWEVFEFFHDAIGWDEIMQEADMTHLPTITCVQLLYYDNDYVPHLACPEV